MRTVVSLYELDKSKISRYSYRVISVRSEQEAVQDLENNTIEPLLSGGNKLPSATLTS